MRVDDWELIVWIIVGVVGGSWDVVGGDWCGGCWLPILKKMFGKLFKRKFCVYYKILQ